MSTITISSIVLPNWQDARTAVELWVFANRNFLAADGTPILSGSPSDKVVVKKVTCTIDTTAKTNTIASFSLYSTTDGLDTTSAVYAAYFFTTTGTKIKAFEGFGQFRLSHLQTSPAWKDISAFNTTKVQNADLSAYTKAETLALISSSSVSGGTTNTIVKVSSGGGLANSRLSDDGTTVRIVGSDGYGFKLTSGSPSAVFMGDVDALDPAGSLFAMTGRALSVGDVDTNRHALAQIDPDNRTVYLASDAVLLTLRGDLDTVAITATSGISLPTISAGTWNGSVIGAAYGGAGTVSGILKANGSGVVSAASAGTDYLAPTAIGVSVQAYSANLTTFAGIAPSANVQTLLGAADYAAFRSSLSLNNLTNDAQTKASIVPNTAPTSGQLLIGNAGGTAYAPQSVSGDGTLSNAGALAVTKTGGVSFGYFATGTDAVNLTGTVADGRIASALTGKTYNGMTVTANTGTLHIANAKAFDVLHSLTLDGTDGSTLDIGAGGTIQPLNALTDTWTNSGTTYTALKMTVTDTASASGSMLFDLVKGSTRVFGVRKDGTFQTTAPFSLQIPDSSTTGGNTRGTNAVDLQYARNAATQVASGTSAFVAGQNSTASGNQSVAIGNGCVASATQSVCIGSSGNAVGSSSLAIGSGANAYGSGSVAVGSAASTGDFGVAVGNAKDRGLIGVRAFGNTVFAAQGDAQEAYYILRKITTDATAGIILTTNAGAASTTNQAVMPNNSAYVFRVLVIARRTDSADYGAWEIVGAIKRDANAASTALMGTPTVTTLSAPSGAWTAPAAVADTSNGGLQITVAGAAAQTVRWVARVNTVEVTN